MTGCSSRAGASDEWADSAIPPTPSIPMCRVWGPVFPSCRESLRMPDLLASFNGDQAR